MLELKDFAERLGYDQYVDFFYKIQGSRTLGSFAKLENDMDVFGLVLDGLRYIEVEMFMVVPPKPLKIDFHMLVTSRLNYLTMKMIWKMTTKSKNGLHMCEVFNAAILEARDTHYHLHGHH